MKKAASFSRPAGRHIPVIDEGMSLKHFLKKTSVIIILIGLSACAKPDIFESLRETGYIMNPNFSGAYEPGTLIQTTRVDREGKVRPFKTPVVITLGSDCFPGKVPQQKDLVLPMSHGQQTMSMDFGAGALMSLASLLNINAGIVKNYSLSFEKPQVIYYPISDIFGQLSPKCVNALSAMQQAGNKLEWFEIIYEVVVANSLTFTLEWSAGATVEARSAQTNDVQQQIEGWVEAQPQGKPKPDVNVKIVAETSKTTELHADGTVVVAYRSAALKPLKP